MITKFTDFSLRFDRKNQVKPNDTTSKGLIEIRMYFNGQTSYKSTGYRVTKDQWNATKGIPKDNAIHRNIKTIVAECEKFEVEYRAKHETFSLYAFKDRGKPIKEAHKPKTSFTAFFKEQLESEKVLNQPSLRTRKLTYEYFKQFRENVNFDEVSFSVVQAFDFFLHSQTRRTRGGNGKLSLNTIKKHHKHLCKYIKLAIKHRYILANNNPYEDFKVPTQPYKSDFLTWEELARFEALTFEPNEYLLERCRDMFLFGCYTGLRFNDVYKLKPSDFSETLEGLELTFEANKTKKVGKKFLYLNFEGKPQILARKYLHNNQDKPLFKGLTNPKVNKALKSIAKRAKVNKETCFKDSRNTFATLTSLLGMPVTLIQDEMQHSLLSTTQGYFKNNNEIKKQAISQIRWKQ